MNVTTPVIATGDDRIDGLLRGTQWTVDVSYSDMALSSGYGPGYSSDNNGNGLSAQNEEFSQLTREQLSAMRAALDYTPDEHQPAYRAFSIEGLTNLNITYSGSGSASAEIRAANSGDAATAYAYYPSDASNGGDIFLGNMYDSSPNSLKMPTPGNYAWHTMLHELGHAFGLKHGNETGGVSNTALPTFYDSIESSVMTYRSYVDAPLGGYSYEQFGAPQTYMMLDIAALQHMYGADFSNNPGDSVYRWDASTGTTYIDGAPAIQPGGNNIFATIWDGGGKDTYDLSGYQTGLAVDLRPGESSLFSRDQLAYLGNSHYARGNIFNALLFEGDPRSLVEDALGGQGSDVIIGNSSSNSLVGNDGDDTLDGGTGADRLTGGEGDDTLSGGNEDDTLHGDAGSDVIYGGLGKDVLIGGSGADRFAFEAGDSKAGGSFRDVIADFTSGVDKLDLTALHITEYTDQISFKTVGSGLVLYADTNNTGFDYSDFAVQLTGLKALQESDFLI